MAPENIVVEKFSKSLHKNASFDWKTAKISDIKKWKLLHCH